jgi:hypothetical protein
LKVNKAVGGDVIPGGSGCGLNDGDWALAATGKAKIAEATALSKPNLIVFFIIKRLLIFFPLRVLCYKLIISHSQGEKYTRKSEYK